MRTKALVFVTIFSLLLVLSTLTGCGKNAYFGVRKKALEAPKEFAETEAAINMADRSPGAQYALGKIAEARDLGKKAVEVSKRIFPRCLIMLFPS